MFKREINTACNCSALEFPVLNSSLPFCMEAKPFLKLSACKDDTASDIKDCIASLESIHKNINCKSEILKKHTMDFVAACSFPCSFYTYQNDRTVSSWPVKSFQPVLYRRSEFLKNKSNLDEFKEIVSLLESTNKTDRQKAEHLLRSSNAMENNLASVMIIKPNYHVHRVEEKEVISLTVYLSQSGGLFSIWIGLTAISFFEILELVLKVIGTTKRALRDSKLSAIDTVKYNGNCDYLKAKRSSSRNGQVKQSKNKFAKLFQSDNNELRDFQKDKQQVESVDNMLPSFVGESSTPLPVEVTVQGPWTPDDTSQITIKSSNHRERNETLV
ncbi:sodium channel, non-voltage-gated 1, gamma [Cichlidogyrus casuarinus]|uniref:Sodium channel, non-voltage-gated 1, gamma n=1 Tax=Cichlidogyrus casuarinus TaxID=1844966 RepID=A0ABD2QBK7_9PLAT